MNNPFTKLGIPLTANEDEIRAAYRSKAKKCHPDIFQGEEMQQKAQEDMIELNLAYEEALKLARNRAKVSFTQPLNVEDAVVLAEKMLENQSPESAMRQLRRAKTRDAQWFATQGKIFMEMKKYSEAESSFREAVHMEPDNLQYGRYALEAVSALKKSKTVKERIKKLFSK